MKTKIVITFILGVIFGTFIAPTEQKPEKPTYKASYEDCIDILKPEYQIMCETTYNHGN